jgi:AraC-like DNA-binding protein/CheY-like chemotaxis protein
VEDALTYRGISHPLVYRAIGIIGRRFTDAGFRQRLLADELNISTTALSLSFKKHTGRTFCQYLRDFRHARAASLLATTTLSVKEIWCAVGYNDASNFDHHFKRRFGLTPTEYRARAVDIDSHCRNTCDEPSSTDLRAFVGSAPDVRRPAAVLLVDDDDDSRTTIAAYLGLRGHSVVEAANGSDGLRLLGVSLPDTVILDFHLPDMSGLEFLRAVRRRYSAALPVAIFTADLFVDDYSAELKSLGAVVASKLCVLDDVATLIEGLT